MWKEQKHFGALWVPIACLCSRREYELWFLGATTARNSGPSFQQVFLYYSMIFIFF